MENIIQIKNLSAGYKGKVIISDVNIDIKEGQCLGIVGESGSGKSTLAKALTQFCDVIKGQIIYNDIDISNANAKQIKALRKQIQMVIQDSNTSFPDRMSVEDYISEGMINLLDISRAQRKKRANELLEAVGLDQTYLSKYAFELSGGQRQRIAITRALAIEPKILICDEVTSALDVSIQKQIGQVLKKLNADFNMTLIVIGHDIAFLSEICDDLIIMYNGKIVERLKPNNLVTAEHHHTVELLESTFVMPIQKI